ncbi:dCMP deaminase [Pseudomonas phage PspYZU05]|uniref:Deoxycytidylate deaminase n=1 Tax=Pseudomonas phage PspYZU05 TaxID=1983556 RepID=A0A2U7NLY3_9CAUD|nr:dCMP deaminase [Pseudomonas phage PspYZU05]ASD52168.1 deoxycytidylate deaminase [Pseudomonas phage PspYZU05]
MRSTTLMQIAYLVSQESKCTVWKVGAVIVKDGRIISTGYNGSPAGHENCSEHSKNQKWLTEDGKMAKIHRVKHSEWSAKNEIHAELNAIIFASRSGVSLEGATLYVTASPCPDCVKSICQSGIKTLVYSKLYDRGDSMWQETLIRSGIRVHQLDECHLNYLDFDKIKQFCGEL